MGISRRVILAAPAAIPFAAGVARAAGTVSVRLNPGRILRKLPADFMGLGYEASSAAMPGLLSGSNKVYVRLVGNLGRKGVIRIGGNVSDFSIYKPVGPSAWLPKATVLSDANFRQLRTFLDATGWTLIWGLNLGGNDMANAVHEAQVVAHVMGDRLLAFEIGNEPDLFVHTGHRRAPYDYQTWHGEYRRFKAAIRAVLPRARFAGPDIARAADWVEPFARDEGRDLALLTAHHYIARQTDPASTLELMLQEEKKYQPVLKNYERISAQTRLPYRLCETASFSSGGKAGVSDTLAAALWALDYLFVVASYGCAGVNMEAGVNQLGWISNYTPISDDLAGHHRARPEYYGLLAFAQLAGGDQMDLACQAHGINLTAYAVRRHAREMTLVLVNKDMHRDAAIEVSGFPAGAQARVMRLAGPSLTAKDGVTLGGSPVRNDGSWAGKADEPVRVARGQAHLDVPAGSAALVRFSA